MAKCRHIDKNGKSLIIDGQCSRCGEEFGKNFINKQRDMTKNKTKDKQNKEEIEQW